MDVKTGRIACCVPGCKRTRKDDGTFTEWVCGKHWSRVSKRVRNIKSRRAKAVRKFEERGTI